MKIWLYIVSSGALVIGFVLLMVSISVSYNDNNSEMNEVNLDSLQYVKHISNLVDSGFVLIVKTLGDVSGDYGPQSQIEDVAGNKIKPFTYYYYVKGHFIQKRWSMNRPESEFIMSHKSETIKMNIKRNTGCLTEGLKVKVFDAKIDPSQFVME